MRLCGRPSGVALRRAATILIVVASVFPASAGADTAVLPPDAGLPWASPNHDSPLEQLLDPVVAESIGERRFVHCEGANDWGLLTSGKQLPSGVLGYVEFDGGTPLDFAELAPQTCTYLQQFAEASPKPTKCSPPQNVYVAKQVTERRLVRTRVRKNGRWVWTRVPRTVHTTETVMTSVPGPPVPCFTVEGTAAMPMPSSYWQEYSNYAIALLTVAHEPFHLAGDRNEATVNCHGLQRISLYAEALGDTPDDAEQIARFVQQYVIPGQPAQYQLPAECRDGGELDLDPASPVWP
jgi:hypothetical protein